MKKWIAFALCAVLALALAVSGWAEVPPAVIAPAPDETAEETVQPGYTLRIDGSDTAIKAGILVPLRATAEALGFTLVWNPDDTITLDDGKMHCTLTLGEDNYQVVTSLEGMLGASAPFQLGMAPCVMNGTIYVPIGIFEALLGSQEGALTLTENVISLSTNPLGK